MRFLSQKSMCLSQITHFYFKICYSSAIIFSVRNQRTKENEIQKITGAKYRRGHSQVTRDDRIKGRKITQLSDKREENGSAKDNVTE